MEAVILAGGKGTRLRPYTTTLPKPLMPVGERAILDILIRQLHEAGVSRITLAVNHMADLLMAFFGDGEKYGVPILYSREEKPLGTVGPIKLIRDLPEHFLVMNGDILTDLDFKDLFESHLASGRDLTISTYRRQVKVDFGVLEVDPDYRRIVAFREKPDYEFDVSMGVYVFSRRLLDRVPAGAPYGLDDLVLDMLRAGAPIHAYPYDGYWLDIGRPDDYDQANQDINRLNFVK